MGRSPLLFSQHGKSDESYESHEGNGRHESHEGHEEEANLSKACQASRLCWQDRQDQDWAESDRLQEEQGWPSREQEGQRQSQVRSGPLDCSSPEGSQSSERQGFRGCQEGHSTLQEGQGVLPVSNLRE